ncbi:oxidative stress survival, Svf1-like protein [Tuber magnatum]|uniref:Oxidative stress survival, Svf1-like protein n=1 Tax=Tuber magnatum TaxID=42249 RepID=A0A317T3I2_9PEZI|nr:oxidative stress survival, Svf1-like protein [Tuber magnatum]
MFSWVKSAAQSTLATVAGTAEPIYGSEAFHSVAEGESLNPSNEITKEDMRWNVLETTSVETQTFYLTADSGHHGLVQIIYSNVANLHFTVQLSTKIFHPNGKVVWSSRPVTDYGFDDGNYSFYAEEMAITMSEDGNSYSIKSMVDPELSINLTCTRLGPGFKIGRDGKSLYGTNPAEPWGAIRHIFWPRNKLTGSIVIAEDGDPVRIDFSGSAMLVMALQAMKPHHAAAKWNFVNFQGPTMCAVMMEFTTPPSYGSSKVNVSGIVTDGEIIAASACGTVEHLKTQPDEEAGWPEPTEAKFVWKSNKDGKDVEAVIEGPLGDRIDRVDVMAEVPAFIKKIASSAAGTKPYIYQYSKKMTLKVKVGDQVIEEEGKFFGEATYICE